MKHKRQILGCLLLLMIFPLGVAIGIVIARPPADSGDVLALAGAFGGSALTVFGAIAVLEWERRMQSDHRRQIVQALLEDILKFATLVRTPPATEEKQIPFAQSIMANELAGAIDRAKSARADFPPMTIGMVRAYSTIGTIEINLEAVRDDLRPSRVYGGLTDLDRHLKIVELKAQQALAETKVDWVPTTGAE